MADRSGADWLYNVSETVASFSITGILAYGAAKALKLGGRSIDEAPWSGFMALTYFALMCGALGFTLGAYQKGLPSAYVGLGAVFSVVMAIAFVERWWTMPKRSD